MKNDILIILNGGYQMMNLKRQYMLSSLAIVVFVFLLAVVAPQIKNQELLFGFAILSTLCFYFVMIVRCGRKVKTEYKRNCHRDWGLLSIKITYYGVVLSLLLNIPMIFVLLSYLLSPQLLVSIFGTFAHFENIISLFIIPWGLFLIVMLFQMIITFVFLGQTFAMKFIHSIDENH